VTGSGLLGGPDAAAIAFAESAGEVMTGLGADRFFGRGDIAALGRAYAEDAIAFPPDGEMVRGRPAIEAMWKGVHDAGGKAITLTTVDVTSSGNLAAETGTATLRMQPPSGTEAASGIPRAPLAAERHGVRKLIGAWLQDERIR